MNPLIDTLLIERFRVFKHLKINGIGRLNLITGRNNTGKSSLLEALRILASAGSQSVLRDIVRGREEEIVDLDDLPLWEPDGRFMFSTLFTDFPEFEKASNGFALEASRGRHSKYRVTVKPQWMTEVRDDAGEHKIVKKDARIIDGRIMFPVLSIESPAGEQLYRLDNTYGTLFRNYPLRRLDSPNGKEYIPCEYLGLHSGERTDTLGALWDKIALTDYEENVVKALRIIEPDIEAVTMKGEGARRKRTAIVRTRSQQHPIPLRSFGDGMNRLFAIALALAGARGGLLLIDEFEMGMHHTVQLSAWKMIFGLAKKLEVQVFATTHSWDTIETFQQAAAEADEDSSLIRLLRRSSDIVPTVFSKDELAVVTRERMEVR